MKWHITGIDVLVWCEEPGQPGELRRVHLTGEDIMFDPTMTEVSAYVETIGAYAAAEGEAE